MKSSLQVGFNKCVKMPSPVEKIIGFLFDEAAVVNSFDAVKFESPWMRMESTETFFWTFTSTVQGLLRTSDLSCHNVLWCRGDIFVHVEALIDSMENGEEN